MLGHAGFGEGELELGASEGVPLAVDLVRPGGEQLAGAARRQLVEPVAGGHRLAAEQQFPQPRAESGHGGTVVVVGIFPARDALIRLVGAVLAEQHDEWAEGRRYLGLDVLARSRVSLAPSPGKDTATGMEVNQADDLQALSA